jgi:hypothetical protein
VVNISITYNLENGQQVSTHWKQNGQFQNIYVQADPANRTLKLFDTRMKPVTAEQLNQRAQQQAQNKKPEIILKAPSRIQKNGHKVN